MTRKKTKQPVTFNILLEALPVPRIGIRDPRVNQRLDSSGSRVERRRLASPRLV